MSPTSRGRKRKRPRRGRRHDQAAEPGLERLFAQTVSTAGAELMQITDPLDAELFVSDLLGTWWGQFLVEDDPEVLFGEGLVRYAARQRSPAALALLCGVRALGTERQRQAAAAAVSERVRAGGREPAWAGRIGALQPTECWAYADVYGDQTSVFLGYQRGGAGHGLVVLVDHSFGGIAKDAFVTADPVETLAEIRAATAAPLMTLREITAAGARGILGPALAATDAALDPPIGEDFPAVRALVHVRVLALPEPDEPQPGAAEVSQADRAAIVAEFLAAPAASRLADLDAARRCIELIVEFGCDFDGGRPLRVSPPKTEVFLLHWLPEVVELSAPEQAMMPAAVSAWVRWAGQRAGLPPAALKELRQAAAELGEKFPAVYAYADWFDPELDDPAARDRRQFTVPRVHTRIDGTELLELDPNDRAGC